MTSPGNDGGSQSSAPYNNNSPSTWVIVYNATPTTETYVTKTDVGGRTFDTTWAVTTSFGGQTSTISSHDAFSTGSSTGHPIHSSNHVAAVVGSIVGVIAMAFLVLFMCKVYYNRRTVQNEELQMTESWLTRPFSRATTRHKYRDMEVPSEAPAAYGHRDSYPNTPHEQVSELFTFRPLSPLAPMSPTTFPLTPLFGHTEGRKSPTKSVDVQDGGLIDLATMQGDSTAFESHSESEDPFLELSHDNEIESAPLSTTMKGTVTFYHSPGLDPFSDPNSSTSTIRQVVL